MRKWPEPHAGSHTLNSRIAFSTLRFSLRDAEHPHAHLVCSSCGRELELDPRLVSSFGEAVEGVSDLIRRKLSMGRL